MAEEMLSISCDENNTIKVLKWKVREGSTISIGKVLFLYLNLRQNNHIQHKFKSPKAGILKQIVASEGAIVDPGQLLYWLKLCNHPTIMNDMCAECGADLRNEEGEAVASVPMIHAIPNLKVSEEQAQVIGKADSDRLLRDRKLVLLVDLDQTLIHTTNDNVPANIKDVYHFQLYGPQSPWYHTRLRPGTHKFLENIFPLFELHICTFGTRNYAHMIATFLDRDQKYFSNRILSRDECFDPTSKKANLSALFPCGDNLVCIIDDREDVWSNAANLIHVKPYHFFRHTGDINAPPGLDKQENDEKSGVDLSSINSRKNGDKFSNGHDDETNLLTGDQEKRNESNDSDKNNEKEHAEKENNVTGIVTNGVAENLVCNGVKNDEENMEEETLEEMKKTVEISNDTLETAEKIKEPLNKTNQVVSDNVENSDKIEENNEEKNKESKEITEESQEKIIVGNDAMVDSETKENKEIDNKVEPNIESSEEVENNECREINDSTEKDIVKVEDPDSYLLDLEIILKEIHKKFYEQYDEMESGQVPDLKEVIPLVKSQVLKGMKIYFSGLVPTHQKLEQSKPYMIAKSLGAEVTQDLEDDSTHLVAIRPGTAKVNTGKRRKNLKIVTPDWLWCCAERWEHADERVFPLNGKGSKNRHPPPHCSSPTHVPEYLKPGTPTLRKRTPSGRFMDTIHPLMSFSRDDIADMGKEVEDILDDESDSSEGEGDNQKKEEGEEVPEPPMDEESSSSSSSSAESLDEEYPRGYKRTFTEMISSEHHLEDDEETKDSEDDERPSVRFRRGEAVEGIEEWESQDSQNSVDAPDDITDGEWNMMGAALEREFLSND